MLFFIAPIAPKILAPAANPPPVCSNKSVNAMAWTFKGVHAVGDSLRDLQAGAAVGCQPHLVLTGKGEKLRGQSLPADVPQGTTVHDDLSAFADWLLMQPAPSAKSGGAV